MIDLYISLACAMRAQPSPRSNSHVSLDCSSPQILITWYDVTYRISYEPKHWKIRRVKDPAVVEVYIVELLQRLTNDPWCSPSHICRVSLCFNLWQPLQQMGRHYGFAELASKMFASGRLKWSYCLRPLQLINMDTYTSTYLLNELYHHFLSSSKVLVSLIIYSTIMYETHACMFHSRRKSASMPNNNIIIIV